MTLAGERIAILVAPRGTEEPEFRQPKDAIKVAGAQVTVLGLENGEAKTNNNDLGPGGTVGADKLRGDAAKVSFVRSFFEQEKPVGVICHGPWLLVEADVLNGHTVTSHPTVKTDIVNAGGNWADKGLVTSRNPKDLPAFCAKIVEELEEEKHPQQARSA